MWSEWWNRFIASDPALRRLRRATRAVSSVGLTVVIMIPLLGWWGQPLPTAIVGAVVAIQAIVAVNDETDRQRRITTLLVPLPAAVTLLLATTTQPLPVVKVLVFLVVIFVATYIRRFGSRYFALGMVGFFGYFFAMFLKPSFAQLPYMVLAGVCGALVAFVLRFVVLPDNPQGILDRGRRTLRAQVYALLHAVRDVTENPGSTQRRKQLNNRSTQLNETALMLESTVQQLTGLDESGREKLRQRILDIELAAENLLTPLLRAIDQPGTTVPRALRSLLDVVRTTPAEVRETSHRVADRVEREESAELAMTIRRLGAGLADLAAATAELGRSSSTSPATSESSEQEEQEETEREEEAESTGLQRQEVRTAVQVTCAAGLAIVFGQLVSPNRWYWAVITAFVVFISTNSRGELLVRAWQRTVGTLLGVVFGILVAVQVTGNTPLEFALVLLCVFVAFYFIGYAYAVATFFITTLLGILYGILGIFDVSVLGTRLAETALGAAAGVLAAVLILPTRTSSVVQTRSREFLGSLRDLLRESGNDASTGETVAGMRESVRDLDDRLQQLLNRARPLTTYRWRSHRSQLSRWLTLISGCAYYVRNLAVVLPTAVEMSDADTRNRVAELLWALADAAGALTDGADRNFEDALRPARQHSEVLHDIAESLNTGPTSLHRSIKLLDRVSQTLEDLAREAGRTTHQESENSSAR
ncbi:putative membrane protein YccC [Saccharopolyspora lacisalsi]|uniref:Putative membrane protein YccC n=1 Tax=Halosaccharopolyspora lacisalsi TaxID=1000566 RepID=A0A839DR33_9PSEU|nr:FUSC family protein [Halosaccharopolyspora lacisalsi]MBA8824442.1 putative membrane protein YccC [Halosaccharopolyspora lacisalsi]